MIDLKIISDSYDSKEVVLTWWDDDPIEIHNNKLQLPQFVLLERHPHTCIEAYKTGNCIPNPFDADCCHTGMPTYNMVAKVV